MFRFEMNKSYSEKLRDPRWQRKRLEIMQRDNFTCLSCHSTTKPLHVHHANGYRGIEPWEYFDRELQTLCEDCHKAGHSPVPEIKFYLAGKISRSNNWRRSIADCAHNHQRHVRSDLAGKYFSKAIMARHGYAGPFYQNLEHFTKIHGYEDCHENWSHRNSDAADEARDDVFGKCLKQIKLSNVVFAWIETADCFGTLAEIGYAYALKKPVFIAISETLTERELADLWFVGKMSTFPQFYSPSALAAFCGVVEYLEHPSRRSELQKYCK